MQLQTMTYRFSFLLAAGLSVVSAFGQNSGLYGKKAVVEVTGIGNLNLVNNFTYHTQMLEGTSSGNLRMANDWVNYGFNVGAGIAVKRNLMLGIEAGWWYFNIAGPTYSSESTDYNTYTIPIQHEMLDCSTFTLMPKITFGGDKGLLPIGINHEAGIGYTVSKVVEKDYAYRSDYTTQAELDNLYVSQGGFADYKERYKGVTLLYGLKIRTPLSKNLLLSYGLRYTVNITSVNGHPNYSYSGYTVFDELREARFRSLLSLNVGLAYAL